MRFSEFRIAESKLREADGNTVYVIGDSHAEAMGGSNNLAANGARLSAIAAQARRVPDGSDVYMTGGHNDVAGGAQPQAIANQVRTIIDSLVDRNCKVFYILFPEGTDNTNQENMAATRQAINNAVDVSQDLDGCSMQGDGIHCQLNAYSNIISTATRSDRQTPESESNGLEAGPPYPPEDMDAVRAMQRRLEALGYSVGSTGIDGKYGPRTQRAVKAFKTDFNIQDTDNGATIDASAIERLNSAERVADPTPTGNERQRSGGMTFNPEELEALDFGGADNERAREIAEEFLGRDMTDEEWDMLVRATVAEASPNQQERAAVMGVILNRARTNFGSWGRGIEAQLYADNQFQAVTGTRYDRSSSRNFTSPTRQQVAGVVQAVIDHLEDANDSWMNFTSNNPDAYGPGTDIGFLATMRRSPGSQVIGGTIFGTA